MHCSVTLLSIVPSITYVCARVLHSDLSCGLCSYQFRCKRSFLFPVACHPGQGLSVLSFCVVRAGISFALAHRSHFVLVWIVFAYSLAHPVFLDVLGVDVLI